MQALIRSTERAVKSQGVEYSALIGGKRSVMLPQGGTHPVLRALELAAGPALQHVAQVDDDGARDGRDVDPDAVLQDLQPGRPVRDCEQRERPRQCTWYNPWQMVWLTTGCRTT